jgi:nitronate monooxygenase
MSTDAAAAHPRLIQGGMGVAVSNWRLAQAVSSLGHLGVVSGTGIDNVMVRRLQDGDPGGHVRRALARFPVPSLAEKVVELYHLPDGRPPGKRYRQIPMMTHRSSAFSQDLCVLASFVEVTLAREGHDNPVGINLLTKVQIPTAPTLYGAMLAGAGYVLMGAGIPRDVPGMLDALALHHPVSVRLDVTGNQEHKPVMVRFDPSRLGITEPLRRPAFFPIVSSASLALVMCRKATGSVEGVIVERPSAGGHNAPPRGTPAYDERGQPIYTARDDVDWETMRGLPVPFWIAGGITSPQAVRDAQALGATGVQVGTLFAFCRESGIAPPLRRRVQEAVRRGDARIRTDGRASSTGYPFKVIELAETVADPAAYARRERVCDLGYLREVYRKPNGTIGYRCAAEPVATYVGKGGAEGDTAERRCLCNGLMATVGIGQVTARGASELPLLTSGDEIAAVAPLLNGREDYGVADVVTHLLGTTPAHGARPC